VFLSIGVSVAAVWTPWLWALSPILVLGAAFDIARGRLGAVVRLQGDHLVVVAGRWKGLVLPAHRVAAIAFGASARPGHRAPETFWRGDFQTEGFSHIVALRVAVGRGEKAPRVLIVVEESIASAREAVRILRAWASENSVVLAQQ
jgi:hypothetical protein